MLYAFRNPFTARRNRPSAEDLRYALVVAPERRMELLSKFPGVLSEAAGFASEDHKELARAMSVVDRLLTDGTNRYWQPPRDSRGNRLSLYPYQLAGVTFILARKGRALIMDPMGLGKTLQGVAALAAGGFLAEEALPGDTPYLPAVVVCPRSAFSSWTKSFAGWAPGITVIKPIEPQSFFHELRNLRAGPRVLLVSKDRFANFFQSHPEHFLDGMQQNVQTVILDESHYAKNTETNLAEALAATAAEVPHFILLTGTPILNAAGELHSQLKLLETTPTSPPFFDTQDALLQHMAGRRVPTRRQAGFLDYATYDAATVSGVNRYLRQRGVRRSREDAANSDIKLYTRASVPDMRKRRTLRIVEHSPTDQNRLATAFQGYLRKLRTSSRSSRASSTQDEQREFLNRTIQLLGVTNVFRLAIARAARQGPLTQADEDDLVRQFLPRLRAATLRGHFPVNEDMKRIIADTLIPHIAEYVGDRERPVIVFADRKKTRNALVRRLQALQRRRQIPPKRIYTTEGSQAVYLTPPRGDTQLLSKDGLKVLSERFEDPNKLDASDRNAVIILTKAGLEALNLAGAEEVVFAGRFDNPGQEYQAEDRINRPEQTTPPKATYFLALDPFSLSLFNRQEKKRNSILSVLGETRTSDYSYPMDTRSAEQRAREALPQFARVFGNDLAEVFFAEIAPENYLREQLRQYFSQQAAAAEAARLRRQEIDAQKTQEAEETARREALDAQRAQASKSQGVASTVSSEMRAKYAPRIQEAQEVIQASAKEKREIIDDTLDLCGDMQKPCQFLIRDPDLPSVWGAQGTVKDERGGYRVTEQVPDGLPISRRVVPRDLVILAAEGDEPLPAPIVQELADFWSSQPPEQRGRGLVALNPKARENLPLSEFVAKPVDPEEEQISRIRTSLFYKFINEGYSNKKSIRVRGRIYGPGERLSPQDAKALAFQIAGRRRGSRFLYEGTNIPTPLSKHRAQSKRQDADAFEKRKAYENMLAVGRKSGPYRVTVEPSYKTGKTVFYIWPMGREYKTEAGVKRAWERLK